MRFVKQPGGVRVVNLDAKTAERAMARRRHGRLLPNAVRCIVCGPSECGKTNVLVSLLEGREGVRFENLYLYSKSLAQPKYRYLERVFARLPEVEFRQFCETGDVAECAAPPPPNSVLVFDDVACDRQNVIREYFAMGRHGAIDCFYLAQTYARIPKHLIRDNANLLVVFRQDHQNLRHIYNDHVNTDMSWADFCELCSICWAKKYGFMVISKEDPRGAGRYRRGFDEFAVLGGRGGAAAVSSL